MLVVLFHVTGYINDTFRKDFCYKFFLFGGAGVDIFFVLSGFIITYTSFSTIGHIKGLLPFIRKRVIRIYPIYWITISIFLLIQVMLPSFYRTHYNLSAANLISTYLLLPGHPMVNGVSWTLTYELFFYFLFSFAFVISNKKLAFGFVLVYALCIMAFFTLSSDVDNDNAWAGVTIFPMNLEFIFGIISAILVKKIAASASLACLISGSILFLTGGLLFDNGYYLLPGIYNRVVVFGLPAFLIILGSVGWELNKNIRVNKLMILLGEASYSLYLLHLPIVVAAIKIIARFHIDNNVLLHLLLLVIITLTGCISILFYKWVEKPVINKLNALAKHYDSRRLKPGI